MEVLALQWSRFLAWRHEYEHRVRYSEHGLGEGRSPADLPDLESPMRASFDAFVDETLPAELPRLAEWLRSSPPELQSLRLGRRHQISAVADLEYLVAAFLHRFAAEDGPEVRPKTVEFAADLATFFAESLYPEEGEREVDGTPYDSERHLLDLLGRLTSRLRASDARRIWEPILRTGAPAGYWVDDYIDAVWAGTLESESWTTYDFPAIFREMVAFAVTATNWTGRHSSDIAMALVCLNRWGHPRVRAEHAELLKALQPEWGAWVRDVALQNTHDARTVVHFFGEPGSDVIYVEALGWLADRERTASRYDSKLDRSVSEMLVSMRARHADLFSQTAPGAESARFLLARLAGRGDTLALQLTSEIG